VAAAGVKVGVRNSQRSLRVGDAWVRRIVRGACAAEGISKAEIGVLLAGDRGIARYNEAWLGHEGPTDVISFVLERAGDGWPGADRLVGDIVVSVPQAVRVARQVGWPARCELAYYLVHGVLHLAGHDDRTPAERRAIRRREGRVMTALGLPSPPLAPRPAARQSRPVA
jgi:probable rRNA maturation factor